MPQTTTKKRTQPTTGSPKPISAIARNAASDPTGKDDPAQMAARAKKALLEALQPGSVNSLNEWGVIELGRFLRVLHANHGSIKTPIEAGLVDFVNKYFYRSELGYGLTPDDLAEILETEIRSNFDDAVFICRNFAPRHAKLIAEV